LTDLLLEKIQIEPGLVALYDIQPGYRVDVIQSDHTRLFLARKARKTPLRKPNPVKLKLHVINQTFKISNYEIYIVSFKLLF